MDLCVDIVRMLEAGAVGYLVKDSRPPALFAAIRSAAQGPTAINGPIAARELEVLRLVATGLSNRNLARERLVSEATVTTHLHHIFTTLGADHRQAAITTAVRRGLIRL